MAARATVLLLLWLASAATARADEAPSEPTGVARQLFQKATQLVHAAQWYEALGLFERSNQLRPHPYTLFNIAVCYEKLGLPTDARAAYLDASASPTATLGSHDGPAVSPSAKRRAVALGAAGKS